MADSTSTPNAAASEACCPALNLTFAFWLLRLFMGVRLILSGLEKMGYFVAKGTASLSEALQLKQWFGPSGLSAKVEIDGKEALLNQGLGDGKMWPIAKAMLDYTNMPVWAIKPFMIGLPYAMLLSGLLILLGLFNRLGWFLAGLIWFSLAFGQMLLPDEGTVQQLGLYLFMSALALCLINHNRVRLTKF
jgi:thiosulfate dehydrogenase [quinone] large subunit